MAGKASMLQRAAEREARLMAAIAEQFEDELQPVLRLLNGRIRELYRQFDAEDGRLVSTQANLGRAIRLRQDLVDAIREAGYQKVIAAAVDAPLDRLAEQVLKTSRIATQAANLTGFDINALTAFKELRLAELLDLSDDVAGQVWRATLDGVMGTRKVADLVADIEDAVDVTGAEARTIYDTSVSAYSRQVEQLHATGEADELFLYAGPADSRTREFCADRVGKVFSRAEIDEMDNGQLPDVMISGGGYNCRHTWKRVSLLDSELQELHTSGGRLAHVEEQLQEVA